eukprot:scaffold93707_cov32-Tisochrysis_lutea.AAC.2
MGGDPASILGAYHGLEGGGGISGMRRWTRPALRGAFLSGRPAHPRRLGLARMQKTHISPSSASHARARR